MTDRQSLSSGERPSVVRTQYCTAGGLRGLDVKYREGGAAPGRWISTCSERLILRVICPLNLHLHLSRCPPLMSRPGPTSPAPVAWLSQAFGMWQPSGHASPQHSRRSFNLVLQPGPDSIAPGCGYPKSGLCTFFCPPKIWGCRILSSTRILRRLRAPRPELLLSPPFFSLKPVLASCHK